MHGPGREGRSNNNKTDLPPSLFLSFRRKGFQERWEGEKKKSIITIPSRMSLFSVHVAKEGRHVCREGENMKRGGVECPSGVATVRFSSPYFGNMSLKNRGGQKSPSRSLFWLPPLLSSPAACIEVQYTPTVQVQHGAAVASSSSSWS